MLSELRRKYWISNANSAARKILSKCVVCRRYRAPAGEQKMSDLPQERLQPDLAPFTNTGVDYFGPFEVKRGRSLVKRYGVLFTCMTSRAIHIEVANSLDTSSCINALRHFVCKRGQVKYLRSDNGTNFVGAKAELQKGFSSIDTDKVHSTRRTLGIEWTFNPPGASHHGGIWERLIKSIQEFYLWAKQIRNQIKLSEIWKLAKAKILGHYNYFGYWMNRSKLNHFYQEAIRALYKWLNRRSQKRSYNWEGFKERLKYLPLPLPPYHEDLKKLGKVYCV